MGEAANNNLLWALAEFRDLELGDQRLHRRTVAVAAAWLGHPDRSLPQTCEGQWAGTKATYRLLSNRRVSDRALLQAHVGATLRRIGDRPVVLVPNDTTVVNFTTHPKAAATMGPVGAHKLKQQGLLLHSGLALDPETGEPLGLLTARIWTRPQLQTPRKGAAGTTRSGRRVPMTEKESHRWLATMTEVTERLPAGTTAVMISDREADIYEYINYAVGAGHKVLLRATHDRELHRDGHGHLLAALAATPPLGQLEITVPRADGHQERPATLTLRVAELTLAAPRGKRSYLPPRRITAVLAAEEAPPAGAQAVRWLLLTTLTVQNMADAARCVRWYALRWRIERLHHVLKSGCQIEKLQLAALDRIRRALAIYLAVACRLLQLTYAARSRPDAPCTELLAPDEWRALACYTHQTAVPPRAPPNLRTAVRWIAKMGGFLGRKGDGEPGVKVLWRGLRMLPGITRMWRIMQQRN